MKEEENEIPQKRVAENVENNVGTNAFLDWLSTSIVAKLAMIIVLIILLMVPISMIESLIYERQRTNERATEEIKSKWGQDQIVSGPVLTVPYYKYSAYTTAEGKVSKTKKKFLAHFLPDQLFFDGNIIPEKRYRGIHETILYNANLEVKGNFKKPDFKKLNIEASQVDWKKAYISVGLTDLSKLQEEVKMNWNSQKLEMEPGLFDEDVIRSGLTLPLNIKDTNQKEHQFNYTLNFNGSEQLYFTPLGKSTNLKLASNWKDPSFDGAFLPDTKTIQDSGFVANWKVLSLNRNFPQAFVGKTNNINGSQFGVKLFNPVNHYAKSLRAIKYAILLIGLTFLVYFFTQIINNINIHPVQYLIVGLGLSLFFTLLIALSEHVGFGYAYLIGAIAIISSITIYSHSILKKTKLTLLLFSILGIIYTFIYVILQLEDFALLMGATGLFIILIIVMYISRKINWYQAKS